MKYENGYFDADGTRQYFHLLMISYKGIATAKPVVTPIMDKEADGNTILDVALKSSTVKFPGNMPKIQMDQAIITGVKIAFSNLTRVPVWKDFLSNALHMYTKKALHKTHCIRIEYEYGFALGQVSALISFEVITITNVRNMLLGKLQDSVAKESLQQCLNVESNPKLLASRQIYPRNIQMAVLFTNRMTSHVMASPQLSEYYPETITRISPNLSDLVAAETFRSLQASFLQ